MMMLPKGDSPSKVPCMITGSPGFRFLICSSVSMVGIECRMLVLNEGLEGADDCVDECPDEGEEGGAEDEG